MMNRLCFIGYLGLESTIYKCRYRYDVHTINVHYSCFASVPYTNINNTDLKTILRSFIGLEVTSKKLRLKTLRDAIANSPH